jgi:hypothetical protein
VSRSLSRRGLFVRVAAAVAVLVAVGVLVVLLLPGAKQEETGRLRVLADPIDRSQQTAMPFGDRSHWLQPWRAYLDTVPAAVLRDAVGINFNVDPGQARATARLLARSGFRRARVELDWGALDEADPRRFTDEASIRTRLEALQENGIRPLILLNSNQGMPAPGHRVELDVTQPAAAGARSLRLSKKSAGAVRAGRTGLDAPDGSRAADVIVTGVDPDGTAQLSRPLPRAVPAGPHQGTTLSYEPFGPPKLADGSPNPAFERTLAGWLRYVSTATAEARRVVGSQAFDVEIWNELSFGSDFLYADRYYDPPREAGTGAVEDEVLKRTVSWLRGHGYDRVGITNGFASQRPFDAGSTSPPGLTALSKHPYHGMTRFPEGATFDSQRPLDARGDPSYEESASGGEPVRRDKFVPHYDAFFPEWFLTGLQTETLIRDLSPFTTKIAGVKHGRDTHPPGSQPPGMWITEMNLDPSGADPSDPQNVGGAPLPRLGARDVEHLHAKATLRTLTAYVNKGVSAVYLFAAKGPFNLQLIDQDFYNAVAKRHGAYPGDALGGETMTAVRRLTQALAQARPLKARPLRLRAVASRDDDAQFAGDGTRAHPALSNREVLAFLPFQVSSTRYVIPTYVMTRSLAKLYRPGAPADDPTRFDLPDETYRLTITGLPPGPVAVSASDPLTGKKTPARLIGREGSLALVDMAASDSPRLLELNVGG